MKYLQKAVASGYTLIALLIGCIAYTWHHEWQDVEALEDGFKACRLLGGCCFVKADSDETGRRSDISGQT